VVPFLISGRGNATGSSEEYRVWSVAREESASAQIPAVAGLATVSKAQCRSSCVCSRILAPQSGSL
jgi:hypothetical protein